MLQGSFGLVSWRESDPEKRMRNVRLWFGLHFRSSMLHVFCLISFFLQGLGSPHVLSMSPVTFPFTTMRIMYVTQKVL